MTFYPGFDISVNTDPMGFVYGDGVKGPVPELRSLDAVRPSLLDKDCDGPEYVYCIAMDVAREDDLCDLKRRGLLYGVVTYQKGRLGREPIRSQGHIHAVSPSCRQSTCEVYEIWDGVAIIYMQRSGSDDAGDCYAVTGRPGDVIIVPPGWVHATVNASESEPMTFGAWCVRDYGFDYRDVRRHGGIAFFPVFEGRRIKWIRNGAYRSAELIEQDARDCGDFGLTSGVPIYSQYRANRDLFSFVTDPAGYRDLWKNYRP